MMGLQIFFIDIHELNNEIDLTAVRIGLPFRHNVFLAQQRHFVFNAKLRTRIAVGDHGTADDHAFMRFQ
jgi:hypothetical protein